MCNIEMTAKAVAVVAIVCGGSSVFFYPKIQRTTTDDRQNRLAQHLSRTPGHPMFADIHGHSRSGSHPGFRAVAEMKRRAASQQESSSNGAIGLLLPLYAAGIVIFYIYSMAKIFGEEEKGESRIDEYIDNHFPIPDHQLTNEEMLVSNNEDLQRRKIITQQKDLEKLLLKADREDISDIEMLELKRQLLKTEPRIAQIQETMEVVQHKDVDNYEDVDLDVSEVDLSKVAEDCIEKTTEFAECFNDGCATDEERNNENTVPCQK